MDDQRDDHANYELRQEPRENHPGPIIHRTPDAESNNDESSREYRRLVIRKASENGLVAELAVPSTLGNKSSKQQAPQN